MRRVGGYTKSERDEGTFHRKSERWPRWPIVFPRKGDHRQLHRSHDTSGYAGTHRCRAITWCRKCSYLWCSSTKQKINTIIALNHHDKDYRQRSSSHCSSMISNNTVKNTVYRGETKTFTCCLRSRWTKISTAYHLDFTDNDSSTVFSSWTSGVMHLLDTSLCTVESKHHKKERIVQMNDPRSCRHH